MKIKGDQLARNLKASAAPIYWLAGDETLLVQEAADQIRIHSRGEGFLEREVFVADRGFNWESFSQSTANLSLFASQKLIELRLTSAKLDDVGKSAIQTMLDQANPDNRLLVSSPKLEAATIKSKWFSKIETAGVLVQIWPIQRDALGGWLEQRLLRAGIQADTAAVQVLMDKVEGNLLAAMQEIEKLKLLSNNKAGEPIRLDANTVLQVVADSSRYNVYQMVDAALLGDAVRAQKILRGLQQEGLFPLVLLNAITRELRSLLPMLAMKEQGQLINGIIQASRVFYNRKLVVTNALQRLSTSAVWHYLNHARLIDQSIKGMSPANPWDELSGLLLKISGVATALNSARA